MVDDPNAEGAHETPACSHCGSVACADEDGLCPVPSCRCFRAGNRTAAIVGVRGASFWKEQAGKLEQLRARFLRDAGFASADDAPLTVDIVANSLAQAVVVRDAAYNHMVQAGGPLSESGKPRRAYTVWANSNGDLIRDLRSAIAELAAVPRAAPPDPNAITRIERVIIDVDGRERDLNDPAKALDEWVVPDPNDPSWDRDD